MLHVPTWAKERIRKGLIATAKHGIKALRQEYGLSTTDAERNRITDQITELEDRIEALERA